MDSACKKVSFSARGTPTHQPDDHSASRVVTPLSKGEGAIGGTDAPKLSRGDLPPRGRRHEVTERLTDRPEPPARREVYAALVLLHVSVKREYRSDNDDYGIAEDD